MPFLGEGNDALVDTFAHEEPLLVGHNATQVGVLAHEEPSLIDKDVAHA